jgi:DNA topoisomerase-1
MMKRFYNPFHKNVTDTIETAERASGERELGADPATGKPIIARIGRFGPMIQLGAADDENKQFASLRPGQSIGTISLAEALELFKLPRNLGEWNGTMVSAGIGRFGPFVRHGSVYASLRVKEGDDPHTVTLERAIKLLEDKINGVNANLIKAFEEDKEVQLINGRFGPYIKAGKENYRIPKGRDPLTLTFDEVKQLMAEQDANPKPKRPGARGGKAPASKKAPVKKAAKKAPAKKAAARKSSGKKAE